MEDEHLLIMVYSVYKMIWAANLFLDRAFKKLQNRQSKRTLEWAANQLLYRPCL